MDRDVIRIKEGYNYLLQKYEIFSTLQFILCNTKVKPNHSKSNTVIVKVNYGT